VDIFHADPLLHALFVVFQSRSHPLVLLFNVCVLLQISGYEFSIALFIRLPWWRRYKSSIDFKTAAPEKQPQ
jgi:hypothetical protein